MNMRGTGKTRKIPIRSSSSDSRTIEVKIPRTAPARTLWRRLMAYSALEYADRIWFSR